MYVGYNLLMNVYEYINICIVVFIFAIIYPQPQVDQLAFDPRCCVQVEWRHSQVQYIYSSNKANSKIKLYELCHVISWIISCYSFIISTNKLVELPISQII